MSEPESANIAIARAFKAIREILDGLSDDEKLTAILNVYAIEVLNHTAKLGGGLDYAANAVDFHFDEVMSLIVLNSSPEKTMKTVNEILAENRSN